MYSAASATVFDKNQLSNRKQYLVELFKALCPNPFVSSINILVQGPWRPTPHDVGSTSSPPSPSGSQGRWGLLLQSRQPYWTPSQVVPSCKRYKTIEVSSPSPLCKIVSHTWNHPKPWDNLQLYFNMRRLIHLSTTSPSTTHIPPFFPPNWSLLANTS